MSPRTHATTKQGKEKNSAICKWAWQGKVQLKIKMSIVQFSTNHSHLFPFLVLLYSFSKV